MVTDWYAGFVLESEWTKREEAGTARYRLILSNHSGAPLGNFRLGFSGPARVSDNAEVQGGYVVAQLSNFCEIAPEAGFVLQPGARWTIDVCGLDYPIRHWTDGATAGFVIFEDGATVPAITIPTRLAGSDKPRKRGTMPMPVPAGAPTPVSIIPWPKSVDVSGRRTAPPGLALRGEDEAAEQVADDFAALTQFLFPGEGLVRDEEEGGYPVDCDSDGNLGPEAYLIEFFPDGATVAGGSSRGQLYGLITLGQMLRGARLHPLSFSFPTAGRIEDAPEMAWRGCHLDVARRFYSSEEIKQFLAVLAWNKLNVFHWHLSDDEAWRVEIDAYPELTETGAWRGYGMAVPPLLGSGPERSGGYYSKQAIRDIVALGEAFGIEIVPEIDVPGHCYALLQALPRLRDPGESGVYHSIQSFPNNCLNPAVETVYPVIETIFAEMIELFPSRYFHVGADEVPAGAWGSSPKANALLAQLGKDGAAPLQAHFLRQVQAFLTSKGKITGAWEEAAQGGGIDKANCYMVGWHTVEASQKLAAEGYQVVVAPGQAYYLDMANSEDWHEAGAAWAGWSSPEKTYRFEPAAGWSAAERARLLGVQACIWCEPMTDRAVFDRLVFPRLSAIAEIGWTAPGDRNFERFSALASLMPNLYGQFEQA
ncbi:MAG: beta-N-acetylhexosaminidase [Devosia sp.]|nr:beta-N-acetylhexosaminidase [Devosia sp.]